MNHSVLVEALRARDPGALAALYDDYAGGLYAYASLLLGSPDGAQVALRDTLIAAEAHIEALADPERLRAWLYALARGEALRRRAVPPAAEDDPDPAPEDDYDGDLRRVAVNAVAALPDDEREVLELLTRHGIPEEELPFVLGTTPGHAEELHEAARARLQDLVATEILARDTAQECPDRRDILAGFGDVLDDETRERLIEHAGHCPICGPYRERQVSAAKVFDQLPRPALPQTLRVRVMSCFIDPELVPYRQFVARRTGLLGADGFPLQDVKGPRWRPQVLAGGVAAVAMALAAVVLAGALNGREDRLTQTVFGAFPPSASPPGVSAPSGTVTRHPGPATSSPAGRMAEQDARSGAVLPGAPLPAGAIRPDGSSRPAGGVPPRPAPAPPSTPSPRPSESATPFPPPPPTAPPSQPPSRPPAPTAVPPSVGAPEPPVRGPHHHPSPTASHQHKPCRTATPPASPAPSPANPPAAPSVPPSAPPQPPSEPPSEPGRARVPWHEGHGHGGHWGREGYPLTRADR
ncbi:sigma-70 family RNA polymerase sigma factor [Sphaerisporangium sp. NPDC051011]|uniref:RNA polymerase sigma factor n=1 Tax=Sphaerisporangium sp. NPDC051011 TaxID=3155792 RepID=UPI0033CE40D5